MAADILGALRWLGLDWDEGPFLQSERLDRYRQVAEQLLIEKKAYRCFCSTAELGARRQAAADSGKTWKYDGICRDLPPDRVRERQSRGVPSVVRFRAPRDGEVAFRDRIFGQLTQRTEQIEDFVLVRSDGRPTYHLGVVLDDLDMNISHVIRGADHISNTPKQILLYRALDRPVPVFAHLPLILGPDRTRLSKRHGATAVTTYRDQGYLPDPFCNFLALLGWSPKSETECFSSDELIRQFTLKGVQKSNAVFNQEKLAWFNSQYLRSAPAERLFPLIKAELEKEGLWREPLGSSGRDRTLNVIDLLKKRVRMVSDFAIQGRAFFTDDFEIEIKARQKFLKDKTLPLLMPELAERLESLPAFGLEEAESVLRAFAAEKEVKAGLLINAARALLTGRAVAPGIFEVMAALGQERTVARLSGTSWVKSEAGTGE
jgi:glutamyl-tRNA synthetase